jgi:hypothetical protein
MWHSAGGDDGDLLIAISGLDGIEQRMNTGTFGGGSSTNFGRLAEHAAVRHRHSEHDPTHVSPAPFYKIDPKRRHARASGTSIITAFEGRGQSNASRRALVFINRWTTPGNEK